MAKRTILSWFLVFFCVSYFPAFGSIAKTNQLTQTSEYDGIHDLYQDFPNIIKNPPQEFINLEIEKGSDYRYEANGIYKLIPYYQRIFPEDSINCRFIIQKHPMSGDWLLTKIFASIWHKTIFSFPKENGNPIRNAIVVNTFSMAIKEAEEMKKKVFNLEESLNLKNEEITTLKKQFEEERLKLKKPYDNIKFEIKKTLEEKQRLNSKTNFEKETEFKKEYEIKMEKMKDELFEQEHAMNNLKNQLKKFQKLNEDLKSEINTLIYTNDILKNDSDKLHVSNEKQTKELNETKNKLKTSETELKKEKKRSDKLMNVKSKLESTSQNDENKSIENLKLENKTLSDILASLMSEKNVEKQLPEKENQIKTLQTQLEECENLNKKFKLEKKELEETVLATLNLNFTNRKKENELNIEINNLKTQCIKQIEHLELNCEKWEKESLSVLNFNTNIKKELIEEKEKLKKNDSLAVETLAPTIKKYTQDECSDMLSKKELEKENELAKYQNMIEDLKSENKKCQQKLLNAQNLNTNFTKQWKENKEKLKNCEKKLLEKQTTPELKKWKDAFYQMGSINKSIATDLRKAKEKLEKEKFKHIDSTMKIEQITEESVIEDGTESTIPESKRSEWECEGKYEASLVVLWQIEENYQNLLSSFTAKANEYEALGMDFRDKIGKFITLNNEITLEKAYDPQFQYEYIFLHHGVVIYVEEQKKEIDEKFKFLNDLNVQNWWKETGKNIYLDLLDKLETKHTTLRNETLESVKDTKLKSRCKLLIMIPKENGLFLKQQYGYENLLKDLGYIMHGAQQMIHDFKNSTQNTAYYD